ncbi:MAG TPA: zinc ribbon domain-containing protein [Pyrinomonadaceae bacterium]|nr:zinc ribbon domain-containing protein [Pyrinomonadaceae bacterium]
MSTDYMSGTTVSDHDLTLAIPGDVATVRTRLVDAIQQLGYKVLGEQPINAKRPARACARMDCSLNVLDYPTILNISLKQANDVSVLATFNFEVKSYMRMTKGDRQTLAREAEAIAALATERHALSGCRACGTQITDESHFCRRCGAPLVLDVPELEILRLTSGARGSYHNLVVGMFALFLGVVGITIQFLIMGVRISPLFWVGFGIGVYGLVVLIQATWQMHFTLNPKKTTKTALLAAQPAFKSSVTTALPPAPARTSVTEGTTELLSQTRDRREKEPLPRKDHDTSEIDSDRLM